jgi:hypothetical protein
MSTVFRFNTMGGEHGPQKGDGLHQPALVAAPMKIQDKVTGMSLRTMKKLRNTSFRADLERQLHVTVLLPTTDDDLAVTVESTDSINLTLARQHLEKLALDDILAALLEPQTSVRMEPAPPAGGFALSVATSPAKPPNPPPGTQPPPDQPSSVLPSFARPLERSSSSSSRMPSGPPNDGSAYVFIDNSNLFYGAHLTEFGFDPSVKVDVCSVVDLIEKPFAHVRQRFVAGGQSLNSSAVRSRYKSKKYFLAYDKEASNGKERFVDDVLLSLLSQEILRQADEGSAPGVIVVVTGDGNDNAHRATFISTLRSALRRNWQVHQWCWRRSRSARYAVLEQEFPDTFETFFLDAFRERITFLGRRPAPLPDAHADAGSHCTVLVDNCHLYVGAQQVSLSKRDRTVRVNIERLLTMILKHTVVRDQDRAKRDLQQIVYVGSLHPSIEQRFRAAGFEVRPCDAHRSAVCVAEQVAAFAATAAGNPTIAVLAGTEASVVTALSNAIRQSDATVHHYTWSQTEHALDGDPKYHRYSLAELREWLTFTR